MPSHLVKTPAGATLIFSTEGYPEALLMAFLLAARSDDSLPAAALEKVESLLRPALQWPSLVSSGVAMRSLSLPCSAEKRSGKEFFVDGDAMERHAGLACAFHAGRPWLNQQAKARGWLDAKGMALELDARFSRGLALAKGMVSEDAGDASLYGCQRGYALFIGPGYVEAKGSALFEDAPISRAKLFESAPEARQFASRKKILKRVTVVEISIRATRVASFAEDGFNQHRLQAAIAQAEAAEFRALLKEREAAELREKLTAFEAAQSGIATDDSARASSRGRL
jgi:hypothetical protein